MPSLATRVIPFLQVRESDRIDLSGLVCSVLKLNYVEDVNMSTIRNAPYLTLTGIIITM